LKRKARRQPGGGWFRRWRWTLAAVAVSAFLALVAVNYWLSSQPQRPDATALHLDIAAGRSGAEVTFVGKVVAAPASSGDHEVIEVSDGLGDQLELDYNTGLGEWIPAKLGDQLTVHGQLYLDVGRAGVHCLHARTSRGCPLPGWVELAGTTYS